MTPTMKRIRPEKKRYKVPPLVSGTLKPCRGVRYTTKGKFPCTNYAVEGQSFCPVCIGNEMKQQYHGEAYWKAMTKELYRKIAKIYPGLYNCNAKIELRGILETLKPKIEEKEQAEEC